MQGGGFQARVKEMGLEIWEAKVIDIAGKHTGEGRTEQKEDSGDLQSPSQVFS